MAEKQVTSAQVVRKTAFDIKDFYVTMWNYVTDSLGYGFSEDQYSQWVKGDTKDIEFHWTFTREQDDYVHFRIWVECKVRGAKKVKVGKQSLSSAEVEVNIKAVLVTDPGGKWGGHPILKHFKGLYENRIFKSAIDDYIARLWDQMFALEGEIKAYFDLPKFT